MNSWAEKPDCCWTEPVRRTLSTRASWPSPRQATAYSPATLATSACLSRRVRGRFSSFRAEDALHREAEDGRLPTDRHGHGRSVGEGPAFQAPMSAIFLLCAGRLAVFPSWAAKARPISPPASQDPRPAEAGVERPAHGPIADPVLALFSSDLLLTAFRCIAALLRGIESATWECSSALVRSSWRG